MGTFWYSPWLAIIWAAFGFGGYILNIVGNFWNFLVYISVELHGALWVIFGVFGISLVIFGFLWVICGLSG